MAAGSFSGGGMSFGLAFVLQDMFSDTSQRIRENMGGLESTTDAIATSINNSMTKIAAGAAMVASGIAMMSPIKKAGDITYFSSSAAYPVDLQTKESHFILSEFDINLDQIQTPDLTYGWAKLTGEMLASHARKAGIPVHIFRPFSGYGSDQALDYPFPSFIERAKDGKGMTKADPFEIWGDGTQVRDFIHIDDVIEGALAGCKAEIEVSNLCTGRATSFNELAELVCAEQGYTPFIEHLPSKPSGVHYRVGDTTHMESLYTPKISLEEGIKRAFEGL